MAKEPAKRTSSTPSPTGVPRGDSASHAKPNLAYSYHTFLFAFLWDDHGRVPYKDFLELLGKSGEWRELKWDSEESCPSFDEDDSDVNQRLEYQKYQYFTPPARFALWGMGSECMHHFVYQTKRVRNMACYHIHKRLENDRKNDYFLLINAIRLRVFNTGIAVMIFETENYLHRDLKAVNEINEWGRRINLPFLPSEAGGYTLCASELSIRIPKSDVAAPSFEESLKLYNETPEAFTTITEDFSGQIVGKADYHYISKTITELLPNPSGKSQFDIEKITPVLDDRMFVCCIVCDKRLSKKLLAAAPENIGKEKENDERCNLMRYQTDSTCAKKLYAFLFVDNDGPTCQSKAMRQKILEAIVDPRWIDSGTIHGVTHHSFMCLTGYANDIYLIVLLPFLIQYVDLATLALMQQASILNFSSQASEITKQFAPHNASIRGDLVGRIIDLQESYVAFQNQLQFSAVTCQEQGCELYDMLLEQLNIPRELNTLNEQLRALYEVTTVSQTNTFNIYAAGFAVWSILLGILALFFDPAQIDISCLLDCVAINISWKRGLLYAVLSTLIPLILLWIWMKSKKRIACFRRKTGRKTRATITKGR